MSLAFLAKKTWHTSNLKNVEKVWIAEQKHAAEQKRLEELKKQIEEERQVQELRELQASQGNKSAVVTKVDWMYDGPMASSAASTEEYLLGKKYSGSKDPDDDPTKISNQSKLAGSLFAPKPASANEAFTRLHEDPLLAIKKKEQEARNHVLKNPRKMQILGEQIASEKARRKEKKKMKKEAKKERKAEKKRMKKEKKERGHPTHDQAYDHGSSLQASSRESERGGHRDTDRGRDRDRERGREREQDRRGDRGSSRDYDRRDYDRDHDHRRYDRDSRDDYRRRDSRDDYGSGRGADQHGDRHDGESGRGVSRSAAERDGAGAGSTLAGGLMDPGSATTGGLIKPGAKDGAAVNGGAKKYGLQPTKYAVKAQGSGLGPDDVMLAKRKKYLESIEKPDPQKVRAEARRTTHGSLTAEDKAAKLAAMSEDADVHEILRSKRFKREDAHSKAPEVDATGTNPHFLSKMGKESFADNEGVDALEKRVRQQRHYQQKGYGNEGFHQR